MTHKKKKEINHNYIHINSQLVIILYMLLLHFIICKHIHTYTPDPEPSTGTEGGGAMITNFESVKQVCVSVWPTPDPTVNKSHLDCFFVLNLFCIKSSKNHVNTYYNSSLSQHTLHTHTYKAEKIKFVSQLHTQEHDMFAKCWTKSVRSCDGSVTWDSIKQWEQTYSLSFFSFLYFFDSN